MVTIKVSNKGNHIYHPLLKLGGTKYETRQQACGRIYAALYDVIDGASGCEMIDRAAYIRDDVWLEDGAYSLAKDAYLTACYDYIMREGYASEDGVTAWVED